MDEEMGWSRLTSSLFLLEKELIIVLTIEIANVRGPFCGGTQFTGGHAELEVSLYSNVHWAICLHRSPAREIKS